MDRKLLFLIADGMGDWPLEALGGRTVLQAAKAPHMDALARRGMMGTCRTVPRGMPPGSDIANMALLGFDPQHHHTGRGPIEAAATGLELGPTDLVWRLNLVTVSEFSPAGRMLDYSAGHIGNEQARPLIQDLQEHLGGEVFSFHAGVQYRHLLVQQGGTEADEITLDVNPPHDILDKPLAPDLTEYARSERLYTLLHAAAERLAAAGNAGKANAIWPWGQGAPLRLPSFREEFGMRGAVISAVDLVKGLGRAAGMDVLEVPGATGLLDTDYEGKVAAALDYLNRGGEFVYLHVEAPDECGHGGDAAEKQEAIERFDARVVAPLVEALPDAAFMVACDHLTPVVERTHVPDPVPFLLSWPGCGQDAMGVDRFDEATAADTGLHVDVGHELLPWCLNELGRPCKRNR
jgi:2,3-bisphosphoglycerate-independent phosphoglycerate mutase